MSGLVRDLLDDHFSNQHIVFSVSKRVRKLYNLIISNFGASDKDIEPYFIEALDKMLIEKTEKIEELREEFKA